MATFGSYASFGYYTPVTQVVHQHYVPPIVVQQPWSVSYQVRHSPHTIIPLPVTPYQVVGQIPTRVKTKDANNTVHIFKPNIKWFPPYWIYEGSIQDIPANGTQAGSEGRESPGDNKSGDGESGPEKKPEADRKDGGENESAHLEQQKVTEEEKAKKKRSKVERFREPMTKKPKKQKRRKA